MMRPIPFILLAFAIAAPALAQTRARPDPAPEKPPAAASAKAPVAADRPVPEILTDLTRLPPAVARMRTRILEAAQSGSLDRVVTVMQSNELLPIFSFGKEKDPAAFWKANHADSDGLEALAILSEILDAPFVHVHGGTPQEMYIWPYFARYPLAKLTAEQTVELLRIVTGTDWRDMRAAGTYIFYRVGIGPDGTWHFFVAGN